MAFPANYNIQYYQGDSYQFVIRPKNSTGDIFPVSSSTYDAYFKINTVRGRQATAGVNATASISDNSIVCTISPTIGGSLTPGTTYFYDVSIEKKDDPNIIYTLLTGNITVTADVKGE